MKYTLIAEDTWDGSKTTREFEVDALPEVLTEIELFLRGAGFFFDGNLEFVNDFQEPEWNVEEWNTPQEEPDEWSRVRREDAMAEGGEFHSKYYFDTERNK
jgi:hypothetical protein